MPKWTTKMIVPQTGKRAVVTGGTDGLGLEIARELARAGAEVIVAGDHREKGENAVASILATAPEARVAFRDLDTGDLQSVARFSQQLLNEGFPLDLLVNNAGVVGVNPRKTTAQGFEWHLGVNYLGHFALTARLFPLLRRAPQGRVIHQSSLEHRSGSIAFDDLQLERDYDPAFAYAQSKFAQVLFALELERRARGLGIRVLSIPVHPGASKTHIFEHGKALSERPPIPKHWSIELFIRLFGQTPTQGALPALFAATALEARGGEFYGPDGFHEIRGYPKKAIIAPHARDPELAERLWRVSELLTGLRFDLRADHAVVRPDPTTAAGLKVVLPSKKVKARSKRRGKH